MEIILNRIALRPTYTIGKWFNDNQYLCDVVEDVVRDTNKDGDLKDAGEAKVMHKTAIPYGRYEIVVTWSNRFKRMLPLLLDVPEFEGIRVHNGKDANSSSGCIITGENKVKGGVINSTYYMNRITDMLLAEQKKGIKSYITIV